MNDRVQHTTDRAAVVDPDYFWRRIDSGAPLGAKVQLINERSGVAVYGVLSAKESFFTHWAPLPKFRREA